MPPATQPVMPIVQIASEAAPWARTGGLGDMVGSLARSLATRGHAVTVYLPFYRMAREAGATERDGAAVRVPASASASAEAWIRTPTDEGPARLRFVEHPAFDRDGLYGEGGETYGDNAARFSLFQRAVLEDLARREEDPGVVHAHDWHTSLVPLYQKTGYPRRPCVLTVHNLAHQGRFGAGELAVTGVPREHFHPGELEFYGDVNWLKGGLVHADRITTVSPTYAREIQTPEYGCGLEGVLRDRAPALTGILNGIDTDEWNPARDPRIAAPFSADDPTGRARCKEALASELGITSPELPLVGMITRLAPQKGIDLLLEALPRFLDQPFSLVVLGVGEPAFEQALTRLARSHPGRIAVVLRFDDTLAHRIEAGCDFFLMPSRFEPCGLNQLYSQRYGAIPIVRRTGGLADTVEPLDHPGSDALAATGFAFDEPSGRALAGTVLEALRVYREDPATLDRLRRNGMRKDFSWNASAARYEEVYARAIDAAREESAP